MNRKTVENKSLIPAKLGTSSLTSCLRPMGQLSHSLPDDAENGPRKSGYERASGKPSNAQMLAELHLAAICFRMGLPADRVEVRHG